MKLIVFLAIMSLSAFADVTRSQLDAIAKRDGWTFSYNAQNANKVGKDWPTGYYKKPYSGPVTSLGVGEKLKSWDLDNFKHNRVATKDQGQCGSCVIFSFIWNFEESLALRHLDVPLLSPQHLMSCGSGDQCNGAYGEEIAADLVRLKQLHTLADYPYTARTSSCKTVSGKLYGQIESYQTIDGSARSILSALHNGQPVSVGIAATNSFGSYSGGVYNACDSMGVNHYVVISALDCESAVDKDGYCQFDAKGELPAGVGVVTVQNSWGNDFGVNGQIKMKLTKKNGQRCLNIAGEQGDAQVLNIGAPMPEDKPVSFVLESDAAKLDVLWKPNSGYTAEDAKRALQKALDAVKGRR